MNGKKIIGIYDSINLYINTHFQVRTSRDVLSGIAICGISEDGDLRSAMTYETPLDST